MNNWSSIISSLSFDFSPHSPVLSVPLLLLSQKDKLHSRDPYSFVSLPVEKRVVLSTVLSLSCSIVHQTPINKPRFRLFVCLLCV